jgi:hypothetical protein
LKGGFVQNNIFKKPKLDSEKEFAHIKVTVKAADKYRSLINRMGNKYKMQVFLEELIDSYEETHCIECYGALDTLNCGKCGKGGI